MVVDTTDRPTGGRRRRHAAHHRPKPCARVCLCVVHNKPRSLRPRILLDLDIPATSTVTLGGSQIDIDQYDSGGGDDDRRERERETLKISACVAISAMLIITRPYQGDSRFREGEA
ncbi:hypothetical protein RB195_004774 [Necator americanus]|uniref:Uncharacterized protein n=1 Tax=Necator americanus TaxID=51031 RepID=A0ABR1BJJ7_NECAM